MIVHFTASGRNINDPNRWEFLKSVEKQLKDSGHEVAVEWLDEAYTQNKEKLQSLKRWKKASKTTLDGLRESDAVIIEATEDSFSMGYQAALARHMKIPILILRGLARRKEGASNPYSKDKTIEYSVMASDLNSTIQARVYSDAEEAHEIIDQFLTENDVSKADMRFNLFLDRTSYRYLNALTEETGTSRAEIIRQLIREQAEKKD